MSDAVVNYFLVDLDIERHFVALHRYLLLQDGEYTQSLMDQLFDKVFLAVFDIYHVHRAVSNGILSVINRLSR